MGKSSPTPPPVYSPQQIAQAQGQANTSTAASQAALNNVDQYSPTGSTTYAQNGSYTNAQGQTVPTYAETTKLTAPEQSILSGQQKVANTVLPAAATLAGTAGKAANTPLNFNTADSAYLNEGPQQQNQQAADAIYNQQAGFLNPQWNQNQQQLEDQLSRQGISVGSAAYDNAMTQLDNSKTQAFQSAQDSATAQGAQSAQALNQTALSDQNQNISQQTLAQQQPISLLQSLLGMSPTPNSGTNTQAPQTQVAPTNVVGAYQTSEQAAEQNYQAQLAQQNALFGGLAGLGGAAIGSGALGNLFGGGSTVDPISVNQLTNSPLSLLSIAGL